MKYWILDCILNGEQGLMLKNIILSAWNFFDFKKIFKTFKYFKKNSHFLFVRIHYFSGNTKINFLLENYRTKILKSFTQKNVKISFLCNQILREIGKKRKKGIFQHQLAKKFNIKPNYLHHIVIKLISYAFIRKKVSFLKINSKISNIVLLKPYQKFYFTQNCLIQRYIFNKKISNKKNLLFRVIKIFSRQFENILTEKNLKYGAIYSKNLPKIINKKKIHRTWQKIRSKFQKSGILESTKLRHYEKIRFLKCEDYSILKFSKKLKSPGAKTIMKSSELKILFSFSLSFLIKKILDSHENLSMTSLVLSEKLRGHFSYKNIYLVLNNGHKHANLSKTLEQIGRQKILHFKKESRKFLENYNEKKGLTEQAKERKKMLILFIKFNIVPVNEIGRFIALYEKKGLRRIDTKVIKRVLNELIDLKLLKIIKIRIQTSYQKCKKFEFIADEIFRNKKIEKIFNFIYLLRFYTMDMRLQKNSSIFKERFQFIKNDLFFQSFFLKFIKKIFDGNKFFFFRKIFPFLFDLSNQTIFGKGEKKIKILNFNREIYQIGFFLFLFYPKFRLKKKRIFFYEKKTKILSQQSLPFSLFFSLFKKILILSEIKKEVIIFLSKFKKNFQKKKKKFFLGNLRNVFLNYRSHRKEFKTKANSNISIEFKTNFKNLTWNFRPQFNFTKKLIKDHESYKNHKTSNFEYVWDSGFDIHIFSRYLRKIKSSYSGFDTKLLKTTLSKRRLLRLSHLKNLKNLTDFVSKTKKTKLSNFIDFYFLKQELNVKRALEFPESLYKINLKNLRKYVFIRKKFLNVPFSTNFEFKNEIFRVFFRYFLAKFFFNEFFMNETIFRVISLNHKKLYKWFFSYVKKERDFSGNFNNRLFFLEDFFFYNFLKKRKNQKKLSKKKIIFSQRILINQTYKKTMLFERFNQNLIVLFPFFLGTFAQNLTLKKKEGCFQKTFFLPKKSQRTENPIEIRLYIFFKKFSILEKTSFFFLYKKKILISEEKDFNKQFSRKYLVKTKTKNFYVPFLSEFLDKKISLFLLYKGKAVRVFHRPYVDHFARTRFFYPSEMGLKNIRKAVDLESFKKAQIVIQKRICEKPYFDHNGIFRSLANHIYLKNFHKGLFFYLESKQKIEKNALKIITNNYFSVYVQDGLCANTKIRNFSVYSPLFLI